MYLKGKESMTVAILSDIHGNYPAFQRCVEYALLQKAQVFVFLGDYVGELAYPAKTMDLIYELSDQYSCCFVRGNKEDYWMQYRKSGQQDFWKDGDSTTGALFYTYHALREKDLDFLESLPRTREVKLDGLPAFTICHGSPDNISEHLPKDEDRAKEILENSPTSLILCGHTHIQAGFAWKGKKILNAGAVGVPLESDGKTQFLLLHGRNGSWEEEFVSLSYDVSRTLCELEEEKMDVHAPFWNVVTKHLLLDGRIAHGTVLNRAMELCRQESGTCRWPQIPEKCWKQAVTEFFDWRT